MYTDIFRMLVLTAEIHTLPYSGGMFEQPSWFMELASWFVPVYNQERFISRAQAILGDGKKTSSGGKLNNLSSAPKPRGGSRGGKK